MDDTPHFAEKEPVALNEAQRARSENAVRELREAVRSGQQMNHLSQRAGTVNTPSLAEEVAGILSLELDVRTYVVEEINILAEAAWDLRPPDRFSEHIKKCGAEAIERGLDGVDPSDRPLVNRTMLEQAAAAVVCYWTGKASARLTPTGRHASEKTRPGSDLTVVIRSPAARRSESGREPPPFRVYPKQKYGWNQEEIVVNSLDEEKALGGGWADDPDAFAPYRDPKRAGPQNPDPLTWVDPWKVPNLPANSKQAIKAALLRADARFWNAPDAPFAEIEAMRCAFGGIAKALFGAGVLTEQILTDEIPLLVWDSAIASGWWSLAAETRTEIFPLQMGHYWVWLEEGRDWPGLFRSEVRQWQAQLLDAPSPQAVTVASRDSRPGQPESPPAVPAPPPGLMSASRYLLYTIKWSDAQKLGRTYSWEQFDLEQTHEKFIRGLEQRVSNEDPKGPVHKAEVGGDTGLPKTTSPPLATQKRAGRKRGTVVDSSKLRHYRGERSQEEFAEKCGVSVATIQRGEAGGRWRSRRSFVALRETELHLSRSVQPREIRDWTLDQAAEAPGATDPTSHSRWDTRAPPQWHIDRPH